MEAFEPIINLLLLLTALSVAAERVANLLKLSNPEIKAEEKDKAKEKDRERRIAFRVMSVGVAMAVVMKANAFTIVTNLGDPWSTVGWFRLEGPVMVPTPELVGIGSFFYVLLGCVIVGAALGFGSKFWHEMLDIVLELRKKARGSNA